jgi:hypothetical protein
MLNTFAAISFPEGLNTQIISGIESAFSNGLTFVAPILVGMVGITIVRQVINRGNNIKTKRKI